MYTVTRFSLSHPRWTIAAIVVATLVMGSGLLSLRNQTGYRTFLGEDHLQLKRFDRFVERFGGGYPILIAYSCAGNSTCESVLEPRPLEMAHRFSTELARLPGVDTVLSPANATLLVPYSDGGFETRTLIEGGETATELPGLVETAAIDPLWDRNVLARGGEVGAIVVQLSTTETAVQDEVTRAAYATAKRLEGEYGFEFRLVGKSVEFVIANIFVNDHTSRVAPVMVFLLTGVIYALFRSLTAAVLALATMGVPALWSQGLMGLLEIPLDAVSSNAAMIVFVVGVCDAVHLLARYADELSSVPSPSAMDRTDALYRVASDIGGACLFTTLTTVVAMASFAFAGYASFVGFAISTATGISAALLMTFSLLPILLRSFGVNWLSRSNSESWSGFSTWLAQLAAAKHLPIVAIACAMALLGAFGATRIFVEVDDEELQGRDNPVTEWSAWVDRNLRAPKSIEIDLRLPDGETLESPSILEAIESITLRFDEIGPLGPSHSVLSILRVVNHYLTQEGKARPAVTRDLNPLPNTTAAIAESLMFAPASLLSSWMSLSRDRVRISVEAPTLSTSEAEVVLAAVHRILDEEAPSGSHWELTGTVPMAYEVAREILGAQIETFALAFSLVFVCLWSGLRSLKLAALGMIPNLLPVLVIAGSLGLLEIPFDFAMTMFAAVLIGIAADDTIHLLWQYQVRKRAGEPSSEAIRLAVAHIGRSVVTSSAALAAGFLGLALASSMTTFSNLSYLTAVSIIGALAADLFVLPALLVFFSRWRRIKPKRDLTRALGPPPWPR